MRDSSPRLPGAQSVARVVIRLALATFALALCTGPAHAQSPPPAQAPETAPKLSEQPIGESEEVIATIDVQHGKEALGTITVRLHHKYAANHVKNFIQLAEKGFYDGTKFHRTSPESFVQGGDPLSRDADPANDGSGGPGFDQAIEVNGKSFTRGAVGAARMGARDNGSQFFICLSDHPDWDNNYTNIGHVIGGLDVADRLSKADRKGEHPIDDFVMTVKVEKRKKQMKLY